MKNKNILWIPIVACTLLLAAGFFILTQRIQQMEPLLYARKDLPITTAPVINIPELQPEPNEIIGELSFPKLAVQVPLVYGYNVDYMEQYHDVVGLEAWGNFPGQDNKLYINGHRHLTFQNLKHLVVDDIVELHMEYGTFVYKVVREPQIVLATDAEAIEYYLHDHDTTYAPQIMRLQTCYPFEAGSTLDHRYLVDLVLVESQIATTA